MDRLFPLFNGNLTSDGKELVLLAEKKFTEMGVINKLRANKIIILVAIVLALVSYIFMIAFKG